MEKCVVKISLAKTSVTDFLWSSIHSDYFEEVYTGYGITKWTNSTFADFPVFPRKVFFWGYEAPSLGSPRPDYCSPAELKHADTLISCPLLQGRWLCGLLLRLTTRRTRAEEP
jgi:hypothetical protein